MLDVKHRFQLALSDLGRRTGLKAAGGVAGLVGAGFLLAALWSALAHNLEWGPALASLAVGGVCIVLGLSLFMTARAIRHQMPTVDDVQHEVQARAKLASEAAVGAVCDRVDHAKASVMQTIRGFWDRGRYRADRAADGLDRMAAGVARATGVTPDRDAHDPADWRSEADAKASGFARQPSGFDLDDALSGARAAAQDFARSRAAPGLAVLSAFAIGLALANVVQRDDEDDDHID